jgi:hypothetical protein
VWWHVPVIPACGRLKQDAVFQAKQKNLKKENKKISLSTEGMLLSKTWKCKGSGINNFGKETGKLIFAYSKIYNLDQRKRNRLRQKSKSTDKQ